MFTLKLKSYFSESIIPTLERLKINIKDAESYHFKAIELSSKCFGEKAPFTARSYYNLGRFYQNQQKLLVVLLFNNFNWFNIIAVVIMFSRILN